MRKTLVKVLKTVADHLDLSLGDLFEVLAGLGGDLSNLVTDCETLPSQYSRLRNFRSAFDLHHRGTLVTMSQ